VNLLGYRAFATELTKIAAGLGDADVRALMAERRGEEYLKGGELPSTRQTEETITPVTMSPKLANYAMMSPALLRARKKDDHAAYNTVRDTGLKTLGGAAGGAGALKLFKDMSGRTPAPKHYRMAAGIGAGVALADKAFRHRQEIATSVRRKPKEKIAFVEETPSSPFHSPADALAKNQTVGKFQPVVHQSAAKVPGLLGKTFRQHLV
jgi:hypothetical protein